MVQGLAQQSLDWGHSVLASDGLQQWPPDLRDLDEVWASLVRAFLTGVVGQALSARLSGALAAGQVIYPAAPFRALALTPLAQVRAVVLGQDPYHGPGQAEGLAFSVADGVRLPPSLRNIFKERQRSLGTPMPKQGSLVHWARQGVLLLNTCLTVQAASPASHAGWGWETLTDALVSEVASQPQSVVFMLWGAHAQAKMPLIQSVAGDARHLILQANHPSPLAAMRPPRPFLGCDHFAQANAFWLEKGQAPVEW